MVITGKISFAIEDQTYELESCEISEEGISYIPWRAINPDQHLGIKTQVTINFKDASAPALCVEGQISREVDLSQDSMNIQLHWTQDKLKIFKDLEKRLGHPSEQKQRKLPRISGNDKLKYFPKNIFLYKCSTDSTEFNTLGTPITSEVRDINPHGALVTTENQTSFKLEVGEEVVILIEPRGSYNHPIRIHVQIVRIIDEFAKENGNRMRKLGMKFLKIHPLDLQHFKQLMTLIIEELQSIKP